MNTPGTDHLEPPSSCGATPATALIAVSLKLYFDVERTRSWCEEVASLAMRTPSVTTGATELVVLPTLPALPAAATALTGSRVELGAQDLFQEDRGAFTGAVSGADLRDIGCTYVEVGHVERRTVFGEDDRVVALKTRAAWRNGLTPILCVGESRRLSIDASVSRCVQQLDSALPHDLAGATHLVVAYEPSWAIGANESAGPDHVAAVVAELRAWLAHERPLLAVRIIYGGSAGVGLLTALGTAVDGLFLGRFAHDTTALRRILDETADLG